MEITTKKSMKMTTATQFQKLVSCMEEYPHLATGSPQFGSTKAAMDQTWEAVAKKVNAYGPPRRSGNEWKKVWADLKCRLKKKISDNNRSIHETGGGPCRVASLTELENDIDRICHISVAAAPGGNVIGLQTKVIAPVTPPRSVQKVAVITPTSNATLKRTQEDCFLEEWEIYEEKSLSPPTKSKKTSINTYPIKKAVSSTTKNDTQRMLSFERKRKHCETNTEGQERVKLLRQQSEIQAETLKSIKVQAEASKDCAAALKECIAIFKTQYESLKRIAESIETVAKSICDIQKYLTEEY